MSNFILLKNENNNIVPEVITSTYLVGKILRVKYSFEDTASDFLTKNIEKRIEKILKRKNDLTGVHYDISEAYRIGEIIDEYNRVYGVTHTITTGSLHLLSTITLGMPLLGAAVYSWVSGKPLYEGSFSFRKIANTIINNISTSISENIVRDIKDIKYKYGDEFVKLTKDSNINQEELQKLNRIISNYAGFIEKLNKQSTKIIIDTNELVDVLIRNLNINNKNIMYSLLLMDRYYVLSLLYLINIGMINTNFIESWISSNTNKSNILVNKLLEEKIESAILNPMKQMLIKHMKNTKKFSGKTGVVKDILNSIFENVESSKTKIKENVIHSNINKFTKKH